MSSALLTDHYELTMVDAALASGVADKPAVFETFARSLPPGRRIGIVGGTGRVVEAIQGFRFTDADLAFLVGQRIVAPRTVEWLADYRFGGSVFGYPEGEAYFPNEPVLTVEGAFAEAVLLETVVLSILNHDTAVASAAFRMVTAARGRSLLEGGSRRTHEHAGVAAARIAYICGFDATSNLEAGRRWGVPTGGTVAHAFVMAHSTEASAFAAQAAALGTGSTFLVDTYEVERGIRRAVDVAGTELGAIRIDSGDLAAEAGRARKLLDSLGATQTRIIASSDLDEFRIAQLASAPIDGYLVGTQLVVGSGAPAAGMVYKLVEIDGRPVEKQSIDKATRGGRKQAYRVLRADEYSRAVVMSDGVPPGDSRRLQVDLLTADTSVAAARSHHRRVRDELPPEMLSIERS